MNNFSNTNKDPSSVAFQKIKDIKMVRRSDLGEGRALVLLVLLVEEEVDSAILL